MCRIVGCSARVGRDAVLILVQPHFSSARAWNRARGKSHGSDKIRLVT